ncbi:OmpA family protein [Novosphingobium sp. 1949]|uniref:OmpA family protein n=1 Tax=Novosphingobium organovorum TaxID=2930092 RepID=A0ABT0BI44_9SPHN|nr:OmpA family protein [Novosphingobium organovorum]MCJ2184731.1 OmpA family protein [Novosphingobium organovorum]
MTINSKRTGVYALAALMALPAVGSVSAQPQDPADADVSATVYGSAPMDPSQMSAGPEVDGIISARSGDKMQITSKDGTRTVVAITDNTQIKGKGGFLGLASKQREAASLVNGLPVEVETLDSGSGLLASRIKFANKDFRTAAMIRNGTDQRFAEQTAATQELRGRMGDIDKYNIKGTTNVHFATGKADLSSQDKAALCATAQQAEGMDNALMLVAGYTDSTGDQDFNQALSEKRAARVVNYLQQACGWKPYRMLTPTGMAEADPVGSNDTTQGKAENRRVAVNILVSKGLDGI